MSSILAAAPTRVFLHDPLSPGHRVGHVLLIPAEETFDELLERVGSLLGEYTSRLFVRTHGCYYEVTSVDMLRSDDVLVSQLGAMEPEDVLYSGNPSTNRDRTSTAIWGPTKSIDVGPPVPTSSRANSPSPEDDLDAEARRLLEREAEDLVEEIARLTTFFDEEERAVVERHRRTPTKVNEDKPSLQDLRRVSQKLEKRWLQQEHARDVKGLLKRVPGGAIVDSPISFGKSKLVGELLESPATVRKTASPEGGRLVAAPPRRTKPKNRLREKMTQAREEKFLQEW